ncbi:hypothetical protein EDF88_4624 [Buttiauxella sp. BIGb0552]|jgi:hypothetical protein|nr:hypothetical protein EDF88_4624 [Buttiauxella sp. BIGb0552]
MRLISNFIKFYFLCVHPVLCLIQIGIGSYEMYFWESEPCTLPLSTCISPVQSFISSGPVLTVLSGLVMLSFWMFVIYIPYINKAKEFESSLKDDDYIT